jgi:uncharacterized protein YjbJ (UPF0337 family)
LSINKDQVEGRVKEAAGKVQEQAGKMTGSTKQQVQGSIKEAIGKAQATYGDVKSDVHDANKEAEKADRDASKQQQHR